MLRKCCCERSYYFGSRNKEEKKNPTQRQLLTQLHRSATDATACAARLVSLSLPPVAFHECHFFLYCQRTYRKRKKNALFLAFVFSFCVCFSYFWISLNDTTS
ncbi:hypothetical protein CEXT_210581 [Caerostris extrusa]|uniref:Transmembrane protein n=1 Tax=Caerostris extrusa TaxID=172846 RepID=A0AAV4NF76_CAEEX|nr:hypothetical protein CEXT_210581 [Caerostris extrusa]